jgi:hypothetical protein
MMRIERIDADLLGFSPPALGERNLYLCGAQGHLVAVKQQDGAVAFAYALKQPMTFQPALAKGAIYAGAGAGLLICLKTGDKDADGWYAWGATRSAINDGAGGLRQLSRALQSRDGSVFPDGGDHIKQARSDRLSSQRGSRGVYQEAGFDAFFIGELSQQSLGGIVCELVESRESVRQLREQFF